ncbi:MAG: DNA cytosine methyltransferase [Armatimonadetes bacterium]|nr:DNA cytosine methyltransferase [Armatimonadota bacterium]
MPINALDLFCGAGGSSWGASAAGASVVCGIDGWELATRTYADNFPKAKAVTAWLRPTSNRRLLGGIPRIDLLLASPECTNHTCARGSRARDEESRRTARFVLNYAAGLKPRWIVIEKVHEAIVPPDLRAPSDNNQAQRVNDVTFEFQGVLGATEYVVQISRNVNFSPLVFQSASIQTTASTVLSFRYNNAQAGFSSLASNTTYFWRVGARSTFRNQPAPRPDGYVFSRVFTFTTADQPPAAP